MPTVLEMVDALLLFNEPILNHRFHEMLKREREGASQTELGELPSRIVTAEILAREGAVRWRDTSGSGRGFSERFIASGKLALIESYLDLAASQTRLLAFMGRNAPTEDSRRKFEAAVQETRDVSDILRRMAEKAADESHPWDEPDGGDTLRLVQEEEHPPGDLRGQVEEAIRDARAAGREPRRLLLSHTALRHLRDQGCFREGKATLLGVRVDVDLGWDAPAFALETYEVVPLEQMLGDARRRAQGIPRP